jgi:hypothetical protein
VYSDPRIKFNNGGSMSTSVRFEFLVYPSSNLKDEDETCFDIHMPLATKKIAQAVIGNLKSIL